MGACCLPVPGLKTVWVTCGGGVREVKGSPWEPEEKDCSVLTYCISISAYDSPVRGVLVIAVLVMRLVKVLNI